jgi:thioredoxin-related protein
MKQILTFTTALLIQLSVVASDTTLVLRQTSYSQVFELAKKEKKAVLLYFHFDGCGACVKMEKTAFVDRKVADFYNSNFVCLEVNTRKGEGIETNKIYNVQLHPTYLFLDANGNELHKIVGVFSPDEFVLQAQSALNPTKTLTYFKQQYKNGKRDANFLFDYCYRLRDAYELDSLVINEYLNTQSIDDLGKEKNIKFIYEFAVHAFKITTPFNSIAFNFMLNNRDKFYQYFDKDQVDTRIVWIVNSFVYETIEKQNEISFNKAIEILKPFDTGQTFTFKEMDGRQTGMITSKSLVLSSKMEYYEKAGNLEKYNETLKQYIEKIWNDYDALNAFAWNYYEKFDDKSKLEKAVECVERSIALNSNYANNDTYACLLYKLGRYDKALKQAERAIELAKQKNLDYKDTTDLIVKIKESQKR